MKRIVVISSTYRKGGNSEVLAEKFAKGAKDAGNDVKMIHLRDLKVGYCIGCMSCLKTGKCALRDDINEILPIIKNAEVLVFATPVYYYSMSGQLKTFLDRLNPLYGQQISFKQVYLLTSAAENSKSAMNGTISGIHGWIDCFDGVKLSGVVYGIGADAVGAIYDTDAVNEAYEMGKSVR